MTFSFKMKFIFESLIRFSCADNLVFHIKRIKIVLAKIKNQLDVHKKSIKMQMVVVKENKRMNKIKQMIQ